MLENNVKLMKQRINLYRLTDFENWCLTPSGTSVLQQFLTDQQTFTQYYNHISGVIDSEVRGVAPNPNQNSQHGGMEMQKNDSYSQSGCFNPSSSKFGG